MSGSDLLSLTKARTAAIAIVRTMVSASTSMLLLMLCWGVDVQTRKVNGGKGEKEREKGATVR
jgi:hypothetical protein